VRAQRRAPRPSGSRADGQHFLRSAVLADELVEHADVRPDDLVVEIGAGSGTLTRPLAERAGRVVAVERDPGLAAHLRSRSDLGPGVEIVEANALHVELPDESFRVFGDLPFAFGTRILRRLLDDVGSPLVRVDALVQLEMAQKRAATWPSTLVSLGWLPWWEFAVVRPVPRSAFRPIPNVDAAMLAITRRRPELLPSDERPAFVRLLAEAFATSGRPLRTTLFAVDERVWRRFADRRGLEKDARAADLGVFDWVAMFDSFGGRVDGRAGDRHAHGRERLRRRHPPHRRS
jgi:16S rRNA A1518/A1519 N6-dimethyltransferase RsmA/KsgA/DIM1 with predicted DNA glycosylase/AP lyase activity